MTYPPQYRLRRRAKKQPVLQQTLHEEGEALFSLQLGRREVSTAFFLHDFKFEDTRFKIRLQIISFVAEILISSR